MQNASHQSNNLVSLGCTVSVKRLFAALYRTVRTVCILRAPLKTSVEWLAASS